MHVEERNAADVRLLGERPRRNRGREGGGAGQGQARAQDLATLEGHAAKPRSRSIVKMRRWFCHKGKSLAATRASNSRDRPATTRRRWRRPLTVRGPGGAR